MESVYLVHVMNDVFYMQAFGVVVDLMRGRYKRCFIILELGYPLRAMESLLSGESKLVVEVFVECEILHITRTKSSSKWEINLGSFNFQKIRVTSIIVNLILNKMVDSFQSKIINPSRNIIPKTYNFVATSLHKRSLMKITSVVAYECDPFTHCLMEPIIIFLSSDLIIFFLTTGFDLLRWSLGSSWIKLVDSFQPSLNLARYSKRYFECPYVCWRSWL